MPRMKRSRLCSARVNAACLIGPGRRFKLLATPVASSSVVVRDAMNARLTNGSRPTTSGTHRAE
jgi:hypothetical protein